MKHIFLTQDKVAVVDDMDYEWLSQWPWHARKKKSKSSAGITKFYAARHSKNNEPPVMMHVEIMKRAGIFSSDYDHKDGDGLNNQRKNLRPCTKSQNSANRRKRNNTTSRFKGVYWNKKAGKWRAQINPNREMKHLGLFRSEEDAARAYDKAALEIFGDFSLTNNTLAYEKP
jgi:hypothetical protein